MAKSRNTRSTKSGLLFPVARIEKEIRRTMKTKRLSANGSVYMAAVMQYLTTELLEVAGNWAAAQKKVTITPSHIRLAAREDEELDQLFNNAIIPQSSNEAPCMNRYSPRRTEPETNPEEEEAESQLSDEPNSDVITLDADNSVVSQQLVHSVASPGSPARTNSPPSLRSSSSIAQLVSSAVSQPRSSNSDVITQSSDNNNNIQNSPPVPPHRSPPRTGRGPVIDSIVCLSATSGNWHSSACTSSGPRTSTTTFSPRTNTSGTSEVASLNGSFATSDPQFTSTPITTRTRSSRGRNSGSQNSNSL